MYAYVYVHVYVYVYVYAYVYVYVSHWGVGRPAEAPQNLPEQHVFWLMVHLLHRSPDSVRRESFETLVIKLHPVSSRCQCILCDDM